MKILYDDENKVESIILSPGEIFSVRVEGNEEDKILISNNQYHKRGFLTLQGKRELLNKESPVFLPEEFFTEIDS